MRLSSPTWKPLRPTRNGSGLLFLALLLPALATAQEPVEPPSAYQQEEERPGPGLDTEMDAEGAQAEALERADTAGLSRRAGAQIEEIVVQARKRDEFLEDTPVSVTALGPETLIAAGVTRIDQIQNLVPNLSIVGDPSGQLGSFIVRGVTNFPFVFFDQGVGVYVDGVFFSRNAGNLLNVVDVAQIEVLRGPQGTLFGKNTVGGAVSVTTVQPREELEAYAFVRAGSFNTIDTRATLNVPIGIGPLEDELFLRLSFGSFQDGGYTKNEFREEYASDRGSLSFLGSLRWVPTEDLNVVINGSYEKSHSRGPGGQCVWVQSVATSIFLPDGYREECEASQPFRYASDVHSVSDLESSGVWGIFEWQAGDLWALEDLAVKLTSSWRTQTPRTRSDWDMTSFPVFTQAQFGGGPTDGEPGFQQQIQQELQLNGTALDGRLTYVGGVFGFWEKAEQDTSLVVFPGTPVEALGTSRGMVDTDNWNWALYGQATADVTDWLSVTGGLRYTQEKKGLERVLLEPLNADPLVVDVSNDETFAAWSPMASIAAQAPDVWLDAMTLDHLMGYFTYARGFRGGGFNGNARSEQSAVPFQPEFVDSFEVGLKTIGFDRKLNMNLSVFYANRSDMQVPQIVTESCPPNDPDCLPSADVLITNAASANTRGFEWELLTRPIEGLQLSGSVGYTRARYDEFANAENAITGDPLDRSGEQIPFFPEWQTHVALQYSFEVRSPGPDWLAGWITPRVDWTFESTTINFAPELTPLTQPSYNLVDVRLSYDFADDSNQIAFWARNLSDTAYFKDTFALQTPIIGSAVRYYAAPRAFGVELSRRF